MIISSPLQNNITNLQNILDTINNLPEAAVASGVYTYEETDELIEVEE